MTPNTPRLLAASVFLGCTLQAAPARTGPSYSPWARCVCTARLTGTGPCCGEEADQTLKRAGRARPLTAPPANSAPRPAGTAASATARTRRRRRHRPRGAAPRAGARARPREPAPQHRPEPSPALPPYRHPHRPHCSRSSLSAPAPAPLQPPQRPPAGPRPRPGPHPGACMRPMMAAARKRERREAEALLASLPQERAVCA